MVYVTLRMVPNPGPCFFDQLLSLSEFCCPGRTDGGAGRGQASRYAVTAHIALPDARRDWIVPLVLWHIERARLQAVTTAHAFARLIKDRTVGGFFQRTDWADRNAGRVFTMHAHAAHIAIVSLVDNGVGISRQVVSQEIHGRLRQFVLLFAGAVASSATNAKRSVEKEGLSRWT